MNYESWRISFQSSESAARQAFKLWQEALAQPAQEPVLYIDQGGLDGHATWAQPNACQNTDIPLYTHPAPSNGMDKPLFARVVPWQGLSLSEINDGRDKIENDEDIILDDAFVYGAQWAEQALKEKNHG